jgi:hypothetical protein
LHLLLGASLTGIRGRGLEVDETRIGTVLLVAGEAEIQVRPYRVGPFGFEVVGRGRVAFNRPRFVVDPEQVVFGVPRFGASALIRSFLFF